MVGTAVLEKPAVINSGSISQNFPQLAGSVERKTLTQRRKELKGKQPKAFASFASLRALRLNLFVF
jgi:hypothetical protein